MSMHEEKHCPRCGSAFECRVGDITRCQCFGITLSMEEKAFLEGRYDDCLCRSCILQLKQRSVFFIEKYFHAGK